MPLPVLIDSKIARKALSQLSTSIVNMNDDEEPLSFSSGTSLLLRQNVYDISNNNNNNNNINNNNNNNNKIIIIIIATDARNVS
uniref:Bm13411 n=1 Tax=Brugia malayi TaxID=6279 RepID=A0A1I9G184_BRUMA|nr:Bm13411 [Brugia malayi]